MHAASLQVLSVVNIYMKKIYYLHISIMRHFSRGKHNILIFLFFSCGLAFRK